MKINKWKEIISSLRSSSHGCCNRLMQPCGRSAFSSEWPSHHQDVQGPTLLRAPNRPGTPRCCYLSTVLNSIRTRTLRRLWVQPLSSPWFPTSPLSSRSRSLALDLAIIISTGRRAPTKLTALTPQAGLQPGLPHAPVRGSLPVHQAACVPTYNLTKCAGIPPANTLTFL